MSSIEVASLSFYPIKSCGGIETEQAEVTGYGLRHDREWMLIGSNGQFLTQRKYPELALVQTRIENGLLVASAPGVGELSVPLKYDLDGPEIEVDPWKVPGTGISEGPAASDYFTEYLKAKKPVRLLRIMQARGVNHELPAGDGVSSYTAFADSYPFLLTSAASLGALNANKAAGDEPITMDRFRTNITVKGSPPQDESLQPYDEDCWREIQIGNVRAFVVKACARCSMPNIEQQPGQPQAGTLPQVRRVTAALKETRLGIDPASGKEEVFFGQNLVHVYNPGDTISVGDKVTVLDRSSNPNWQPKQ